MALVRWDPFAELDSLHNQVNTLFNDAFGSSKGSSLALPVTDVYSDDKALTIEAHLSNFKEDEISVEQHQGELEIKAEHQEKQDDNKKYLTRESVSKYYRRFTLPKNTDGDNVTAKFDNGILRVMVPLKELPAPKKIKISSKASKSQK